MQCTQCGSTTAPIPVRIPLVSDGVTLFLCPFCCHAEPNGMLLGEQYDEADMAAWRHNDSLNSGLTDLAAWRQQS